MNIENKIEFASNLAQSILEDLHFNNKLRYISFAESIYDYNNDGDTTYKEDAQNVFNEIYDIILNFIEEHEEK